MDKSNDVRAESRDEFEYATNWVRAYQRLYRELKWLNAYAVINEIAALRIMKKFIKYSFKQPDNIVDKNIQLFLK